MFKFEKKIIKVGQAKLTVLLKICVFDSDLIFTDPALILKFT